MNTRKHRPVICILDSDKERCVRQEKALDQAIASKRLPVSGISNFGTCHLARTGYQGEFPVIDVDGVIFAPKNAGQELTFEALCDFLDILVKKGIIPPAE